MPLTTRILSIASDDPDEAALETAANLIRSGGLVAFATETVYGLGADATNPDAIERLYQAKGRPPYNPLIVHVDSIDRARTCVALWDETAQQLAEAFWPGPLTLVLPRSDHIPPIVAAGRETVGIRVPQTLVARRLIERAGVPLAAPSANRSNGLSPTLADHVQADLDGQIDLILDSGPTAVGLESTVLDLTTREPRVLRPGPITVHELEHVLGGLHVRHADGDPAAVDRGLSSPGQMPVHYAPRTTTLRASTPDEIEWFEWPEKAALVVVGPHVDLPAIPEHIRTYHLPTPEVAARALYSTLHTCDRLGLDLIVIIPPADLPEWHAVRDRLSRAARPLHKDR